MELMVSPAIKVVRLCRTQKDVVGLHVIAEVFECEALGPFLGKSPTFLSLVFCFLLHEGRAESPLVSAGPRTGLKMSNVERELIPCRHHSK
jgi:hypothetical protein